MRFKDVIGMAFKDLGKRKGRTFLTSLAVAIGSMLILTMVGIGTTAENYALEQLKKFGNLKQVSVMNQKYRDKNEAQPEIDTEEDYREFMEKNFKKIDKDTVRKVSGLNGVQDVKAYIVSPQISVKVDGKELKGKVNATGLDLDYKVFNEGEIESVRTSKKDNSIEPVCAGRNLTGSDKTGVLAGQQYLKEAGITDYKSVVGKDITLVTSKSEDGNINLKPMEIKGQIVGVIDERFEESNGIIVPMDVAATLKGYSTFNKNYMSDKGYDGMTAFAKSAENVGSIGKDVKNMGYDSMSYEDIANEVKDFFTIGKEVLAVLGLIVLFVAAVGIVNTMTMSIHERTKYIGIMKSMGANRQNIHGIFLAQAGAIGFIGGIMGLGFSFLNSKIFEVGMKMYLEKHGVKEVIKFSMPSWLVFGTLAFAIVISLASGVYPSRKASRMDPVEALNS